MATKTVEIQQIQALKELLSLVDKGTEVILTRESTPIARLVPIVPSPTGYRVAGLHPGTIWMSDDFDEPLPIEFWLGEDEIIT